MCEKIFNQFLFFSYQINKFYSYQSLLETFLGVADNRARRNLVSREGIDIHQISGRTYATIRPSYQILVRHKCTIELQT